MAYARFKQGLYNKWLIAATVILLGSCAACSIYYYGFLATKPSTGTGEEVTAEKFGTAFNGIAGTAITILGLAFLAYAYLDQRKQSETGLFNKLYEDLLDDINSIQYRKAYRTPLSSPDDSELFQGVDALFNYEFDRTNRNSVLNHVMMILVSFNHLIGLINRSVHYDEHFRGIMLDKLYFLFLAKIFWAFEGTLIINRNTLLVEDWGYPQTLLYNFEKLMKEAHLHLYRREHISFGPRKKYDPNVQQAPAPKSSSQTKAERKREIEASLQRLLSTKTKDVAWERLRSFLNRDFNSLAEYWKLYPPESPEPPYLAPPDSRLFRLVRRVLNKSELTDALIHELDSGRFLSIREFFVWLKTAPSNPSKYVEEDRDEESTHPDTK